MRPSRAPLFLARRSYRVQRLRDFARLLPVLGTFLVLLPVLWIPDATSVPDTAPDGIYLFAVWAGLVVAAALMARGLGSEATKTETGAGAEGEGED
ncbi:MAG: hypothetical protein Q8O82_17260 [Pseudorhodobacter sp.]|nr:hypothetical protein [Pseudorhodobacter sp.]